MLRLVLIHLFGCCMISNNVIIHKIWTFRETAKIDLMTNFGYKIVLWNWPQIFTWKFNVFNECALTRTIFTSYFRKLQQVHWYLHNNFSSLMFAYALLFGTFFVYFPSWHFSYYRYTGKSIEILFWYSARNVNSSFTLVSD